MAHNEKHVDNTFYVAGDHLISAYDCYINGDRKGAAMHSMMAFHSPDMPALIKFLRNRISGAEEAHAEQGDKKDKEAVASYVASLGYDTDPNCTDALVVDRDFSDPDAEVSEEDESEEDKEPKIINTKEFENPEGAGNIYVESSAKSAKGEPKEGTSEKAVEDRVLSEEQKALAERHQALAAIHKAIALHHARGEHGEGDLAASGAALAKSEHHIAVAKGIIGEERVREARKDFAKAVHKKFGLPGKNFDVKAAADFVKPHDK